MIYFKSSKFRNKKVEFDGYKWDSKKERDFYIQLKLRKKVGDIKDFKVKPKVMLQARFKCWDKIVLPIFVIPDFLVYYEPDIREFVDTKGVRTESWNIKWKMLKNLYKEKYNYTIV